MKLILSITSLYSLFLLGCATSGREINPDDIAKLEEGMSIQEVEMILGLPEHISTGEEGKFYYLYHHGSAVGFMGASKSETVMLNLTFDSTGTLAHIDNQTIHKASKPLGSTKTTHIDSQNQITPDERSTEPAVLEELSDVQIPAPVIPESDRAEERYKIIRLYVSGEISKQEYRKLMDNVR